MIEKNYLTKEEQKLWEYIKEKEIVDNELVEMIFPEIPENKRNKLLHSLHKKGHLRKLRRNLYFNPEKTFDFHKLALNVKEGYIGLSSALRRYNLIDYEDFTIFVITKKFKKTMQIEGTQYEVKFVPLKNLFTGFVKIDDIYISTVEKTIFDCLLKPNLVGLSIITKAIYEAEIDWKKFLDYFKLTKNNALCQRTGYILETLKKRTKMKVPLFVFDFLAKRVKNPIKLAGKGKTTFNKKWKVQDSIGEKNIISWWY